VALPCANNPLSCSRLLCHALMHDKAFFLKKIHFIYQKHSVLFQNYIKPVLSTCVLFNNVFIILFNEKYIGGTSRGEI
jgi:hypothetical protein